jgi:hypothetical protein
MTTTESPIESTPTTNPAAHTEYPDAVWMALGAVATVGVSFFLCQLPYGRPAAVVLSLAAVALAGLSLLGLTRRAWLGRLGVGANALFALLLVGFPEVFGLTGWWPVRTPEALAPVAGMTSDGWVDAGAAAWEENGVRVALTFATVSPPPAGSGRAGAEPNLWVGVRVLNTGARAVDFTGWDTMSPGGPVLTTTGGAVGGQRTDVPKAMRLAQGQAAECVLAFRAPPGGQALRLELPAGAYGGTTPARFEIAAELILRK